MKKFVLFTLSLLCCLTMLCGCGGESITSYNFKGYAGEKISVGEVSGSGYKVGHKGQTVVLLMKDKATIMEGYLDGDSLWTAATKTIESKKVEVIAQEDEKLIYKDGDKYTAVFMVPGALSYVILEGRVTGDVTDDDIQTALDNLRVDIDLTE